MGYCYGQNGLACDKCDTDEPDARVRKRPCPVKWCQAPALCAACNREIRDSGEWARYHEACPRYMAESRARDAEKERILATGKAIRVAALGMDDGRVHVIFRRADGTEEGWYMSKAAYDAFPLLVPVTPEMYSAHGSMEPAPTEFRR